MPRDRDRRLESWEEWVRTYDSQGEAGPTARFPLWSDRAWRQQGLCFLIGMAAFLPLGLRAVSAVGPFVQTAPAKDSLPPPKPKFVKVCPQVTQATHCETAVLTQRKAKRRFLALNTNKRLALFALEPNGGVASKPSDVLNLNSRQGSQLVVHPCLNVLYECSLDETGLKLVIQAFSIDLQGKLIPLGQGPFIFNIDEQQFRGAGGRGSLGIAPCLDATGTYLYITQTSRGGATGQTPQIPYFRLNSQGLIEGTQQNLRLDFPQDRFYSICLEPGPAGSDDLYAFIMPSDSSINRRTAYHCKVLPNGLFELDTKVESNGGPYTVQGSDRFLRRPGAFGSGPWEGLRLDDEGRIVEAYHWPVPMGTNLVEMMPGYAINLKQFKDTAEAQLYTLDLENDRPTATSSSVSIARIYGMSNALGDPETSQVFYFAESPKNGIELVRIALHKGRLQTFAPQKLDDCGFLTAWGGKVQILSVY